MINSFLSQKKKLEMTPINLGKALQQAIEIEIATIPVYLFTYYSIHRTPKQEPITADLTNRLINAGMPKDKAAAKALELSANIMVFANKAGALIISVAIEEMLHMSLSSNVKQALVGPPVLVGKSPPVYPAYLAGHEPPFPINLASFSLDQLYTFLEIESPKKIPGQDEDFDKAYPYPTIGEFYQWLIKFIEIYKGEYHIERPQLVPKKGYYAQNNINTNFYDKHHKPHFVNAHDSGDLIHVVDTQSAVDALNEIIEQGEGQGQGDPLPKNKPDLMKQACKTRPTNVYDDEEKKEKPHYEKFFDLYCELMREETIFKEILKDEDFDFKQYFVYNFQKNPVSSDYPEAIQNVAVLINAIYTYVFLMSEACYHKDGNTQYEIFMFGIHKTMMWILGSLCETIRKMNYVGSDGKQYNASATFENYEFTATPSPKEQIIRLFNQAAAGASQVAYVGPRIHDLPNVYLEPYQKKTGESLMAG